jgi:hypothetical protein
LPELQATDGTYYKRRQRRHLMPRQSARNQPAPSQHGYYRPDVRSQGPADNVTLSKIFSHLDGLARFAAERYAAWRLASLAAQ